MRSLRFIFAMVTLIFACYVVLFPWIAQGIRRAYQGNGHGDQLPVFLLVLGSFISPMLFPFLHAKNFILNHMIHYLGIGHLESELSYLVAQYMLTPNHPFQKDNAGPPTDYSNILSWSMMPGKPGESGELYPPGTRSCEEVNLCDAPVDTFYLHPSTWYTPISWNGPSHHSVPMYLSDDAIGPQNAVFNIASKIYAPRYRQMCAGAFVQPGGLENENSKLAFEVAWEDVRNAFQYYLDNFNPKLDRGIIIAGHSQGSVFGDKILKEFFVDKPLSKNLVAAYLVGWTFFNGSYNSTIQPCKHAKDVHCVLSWRTFQEGGNPLTFLHVKPPKDQRPICHNPLSWTENDGIRIEKKKNLGALDLMHPWTMWNYLFSKNGKSPKERVQLPEVVKEFSDAVCKDGNLFVQPLPHIGFGWGPMPHWTFASFPGMNLHPYDYNLFYGNIRENVRERVISWLGMNSNTKQ